MSVISPHVHQALSATEEALARLRATVCGAPETAVTPVFRSVRGVNRVSDQPIRPATGSTIPIGDWPMYRAYRLEIPASYAVRCAVFLVTRAAPHGSANQGALAARAADYWRLQPGVLLSYLGQDWPEETRVLAQMAVNAGRVYGGDYPSLPVSPEHSRGVALLLVSASAAPTGQSCADECLFLMPLLGLSSEGLLEPGSEHHRPLVLWRGREVTGAPVTLSWEDEA